MSEKLPVCPHCGSKEVIEEDGFYRCQKCTNDFGRKAVSDDGQPMVDVVKGLRFSYGSLLSSTEYLRIAEDGKSVVFEAYRAMNGKIKKNADVLEYEDWQKMKKFLFEQLFVNDWDREYLPVYDGEFVPDGMRWELSLIVDDDEELTIKGSDAYPVYWKSFEKIITKLLQRIDG